MTNPKPAIHEIVYLATWFCAIITLLAPADPRLGLHQHRQQRRQQPVRPVVQAGQGGVLPEGRLQPRRVSRSGSNQVSGSLAAGRLVESLRTRAELKFEESENDAIISVLCPGENAGDCAGRPDEQEMVQYYLTRRFNIKG